MKAEKKQDGENQSITAIVRRRIKSGYEQEFEIWSKDIARECQKYEGFLGIRVIRPDVSSEEHVTIITLLMGYITLPGVTRILRAWLRESLD